MDCSHYKDTNFKLIKISQCLKSKKEVIPLQDRNALPHPYSINVLGVGPHLLIFEGQQVTKDTSDCLHGGYKLYPLSRCICPPGFTGPICETGCGPNSYGADCKGICSLHDRMCRGMLMCTTYGCTCPVGLTGPWCNQDCESGKYGADCNQTCSSNCYNNSCDPYTGICSRGCVPGYVFPRCLEKYPYLINPPELISSQYESLEIKLNLNSTNIKGGDNNIEPKYYQLLYKAIGRNCEYRMW
ncbi:tyrosine-protein kinase receptor Tie-2-like [Sipha flava]|uniref:Tyrosine-protein kinase receptor Tie-2-like n=1 Tax=Sipha flava TaxID=143950 RepID=A0A8B8FGB8_9HEMI|nr:tyrosine-protein kinase receptor Tie-2-like [Sipha flava]